MEETGWDCAGTPSVCTELCGDGMVVGDEESEITRSTISAPMRHKGQVIGAISAQSYRPRAYTP